MISNGIINVTRALFSSNYDNDRAWAMHYPNEIYVFSVFEEDEITTSSGNGGGGIVSILFVSDAMTKVWLGARVWIRVRFTVGLWICDRIRNKGYSFTLTETCFLQGVLIYVVFDMISALPVRSGGQHFRVAG